MYSYETNTPIRFDGDIIIIDPSQFISEFNPDDWDKCNYGENLEELGIKNFLCPTENPIEGEDWVGSVYAVATKHKLGSFWMSSEYVGVFLLEEVLKYNPEFVDILNEDDESFCCIKNFHGEVIATYESIADDEDEDYIYYFPILKGKVILTFTQK